LLAVAGLLMPALLILTTPQSGFIEKEVVSGIVGLVLTLLFGAPRALTRITLATRFRAGRGARGRRPGCGGRPGWGRGWSPGLSGVQLVGAYTVIAAAAFFIRSVS